MFADDREFLDQVRHELHANLGEHDDRGYLVRAAITLTAAHTGAETVWSPGDEHVELISGELWASPTPDDDVFEVVSYPHARRRTQVMTTARVHLNDLLGALGVYEYPRRIGEFTADDHHVQTTLPLDHPAHDYHVFIEDMWDNLAQLCSWNNVDPECAPPRPALIRQPDGTWEISVLFRIHDPWTRSDEYDARSLCGLIRCFPGAQWQISAATDDTGFTPARVWRLLDREPRFVAATPRDPQHAPESDTTP